MTSFSKPRHKPGVIHPWVFDQDQVWVDAKGREHKLCDMDEGYIENVIRFLLRKPHYLMTARVREYSKEINKAKVAGNKNELVNITRTLLEMREEFAKSIDSVNSVDAFGWLEKTPLMQELRRREKAYKKASHFSFA